MAKHLQYIFTRICLIIAIFTLTTSFFACGGQKAPSEQPNNPTPMEPDTTAKVEPPIIVEPEPFGMERYLSGVVLIRTMYYYKISFDDVLDVYFSGVDEDGDPVNLTVNESEIVPRAAYGTGFFVNTSGLIVTNSHVVNPSVESKGIRSSLLGGLSSISSELQEDVNNLNVFIAALTTKIADTDDPDVERDYMNEIKKYMSERKEKQNIINGISRLHGMDYTVTCERMIGIAFNDTYITKQTDFIECVPKEEDKENDLALIQLKKKGADVPNGSYVFEVPFFGDSQSSESNADDIKLGTELTMIAFNLGPTLALTDDGIMAQITSGKCTQIQNKKIMYDIASLPGSSGAPVIDENGVVVAVNFAGISSTQGFNYGVKAYLLRRLLNRD